MTSQLYRVLFITFYTLIIFTLEFALSHIPNVQVTTILFMILFEKTNRTDSHKAIALYIALQGLVWGFGFYLVGMTVGWLIWSALSKIFRYTRLEIKTVLGFIFAFIYGVSFYPLTGVLYGIPFIPYLIADFPFALTMGVSNFLSILWLYTPLERQIKLFY